MKSLNSAISESNIKAEPRDEYISDSPFRLSSSKPSYSQDLSATLNRGLLTVNRKESDYFLVVAKIILNSPEAIFKVRPKLTFYSKSYRTYCQVLKTAFILMVLLVQCVKILLSYHECKCNY